MRAAIAAAHDSVLSSPGGNPGAHGWFLKSTPIQMLPFGGSICGRLTEDLHLGYFQAGVVGRSPACGVVGSCGIEAGHDGDDRGRAGLGTLFSYPSLLTCFWYKSGTNQLMESLRRHRRRRMRSGDLIPPLGTLTHGLLLSWHPGSVVQIRQLWRSKTPEPQR